MTTWRDYLFKPGHIVFFVFYSPIEGKTVASGVRILEYEDQAWYFTQSLGASGESDDIISDWKPQPSELEHSIFYVDEKHSNEFIQLFMGTKPIVKIFLRYAGGDYRGRSPEKNPRVGESTWAYFESPYESPDPVTEMFGLYTIPEPTFTLRNDKPFAVSVSIRFVGRRYRFAPLTKEETMKVLETGRYTIRVLGSLDRPIEIGKPERVFATYIPITLLMEVR